MSENNKWNGKHFLIGAAVGAAIGTVTALLFAPKPGKELREDLAAQVQQVSEKTQEIAGTVKTRGQELAGKAKEVANLVTTDLKNWQESRKEAALAAVTVTEAGAETAPSAREETAL